MYRKVNPNTNLNGESRVGLAATREIAALDFLLGIPMESERDIVLAGLEAERHVSLDDGNADEEKVEIVAAMVQSDLRIFNVKNAEMKRREQIELETGVLERPSDLETSSKDGGISIPIGADDDDIDLGNFKKSVHSGSAPALSISTHGLNTNNAPTFIPGRRLDGHEAVVICIPTEASGTEKKTRYRTVALKAAEREWEQRNLQFGKKRKQGLLDGRIFFSGQSSYPLGVFSVIKYDPKNEEEIRRRQRLEAQGKGGAEFIMETRDWRGVSYRQLLPRKIKQKNTAFNQMLERRQIRSQRQFDKYQDYIEEQKLEGCMEGNRHYEISSGAPDWFSSSDDESGLLDGSGRNIRTNPIKKRRGTQPHLTTEDEESEDDVIVSLKSMPEGRDFDSADDDDIDSISSSSSEELTYKVGYLDDPEIRMGKHRTNYLGDSATGCIVSSIIHYVSPADLKADLNMQFRQRFDQWEGPTKSQRKYIGARIVGGTYTLFDQVEVKLEECDDGSLDEPDRRRQRKNSSIQDFENIRMPPSLTLSKIRNLKSQALQACIKARLEVSTVAIACVYFERLALDCRVDKSNRRLTFATCLLIAIKVNEANVKIVHEEESNKVSKRGVLKSIIKPRQDYDFFASLFTFFTHEWGLSLKQIFNAEWGIFSSLGFKLHAKPSEVSFHFRRFMRALEWSPLDYLGQEMYGYWQGALIDEEAREREKASRREKRRKQKEKKILKLQRKLQEMETGKSELAAQRKSSIDIKDKVSPHKPDEKGRTRKSGSTPNLYSKESPSRSQKRKAGLGIFSRINLPRKSSNDLRSTVSLSEHNLGIGDMSIHRSISSPNLVLHDVEQGLERSEHSANGYGWSDSGAIIHEERLEDLS